MASQLNSKLPAQAEPQVIMSQLTHDKNRADALLLALLDATHKPVTNVYSVTHGTEFLI